MAIRPVEGHPVMQLLQPMVHVSPRPVDLIDRRGRVNQVGDHEPGVVLGVAAGMADDFGLHHHPAFAPPALRHVPSFAELALGLPAGLGAHTDVTHHAMHPLLQPGIALAIATTYSTPSASKNSSMVDPVNPPWSRTRTWPAGRPPAGAGTGDAGDRSLPQAARSQDRGDQILPRLGIERQRGDQQQITPALVVAIEEGQLLLARGGAPGAAR